MADTEQESPKRNLVARVVIVEEIFEQMPDGAEVSRGVRPHVHRSTNPVQMDFGGTINAPGGQQINTMLGYGRFCDGCGLLYWTPANKIPIIGAGRMQ